MGRLLDELKKHHNDSIYPFHMPGHKRNVSGFSSFNPYEIDITEIDNFDNLHHAEGIIKDCMEEAARVYSSDETFFLINGSTSGILSAFSGCFKEGDKVLFLRNSHKAAYNALLLNHLVPIYIYPEVSEDGIVLSLRPEVIEKYLENNSDIKGIYITSPTYDGVVTDIRTIVNLAHSKNIPVIVDEAHGAHFILHDSFPDSAVNCGADVVINSIHKTLPAFTQTALIHLNGNLTDRERIKRYLRIYQSSSPSYILMAGIDQCINYINKEGRQKADEFFLRRRELTYYISSMKNLQEFDSKQAKVYDYDLGKLLIKDCSGKLNGRQLYEYFLEKHKLQCEMAAGKYVTFILTIMDSMDGFNRLREALKSADEYIASLSDNAKDTAINYRCSEPIEIMSIGDALNKKAAYCPLEDAAERVSADFVNAYPPGIPVIVPGEKFDDNSITLISSYLEQNLTVEGITDNRMVRYIQ